MDKDDERKLGQLSIIGDGSLGKMFGSDLKAKTKVR
jgi:hypothetical protein